MKREFWFDLRTGFGFDHEKGSSPRPMRRFLSRHTKFDTAEPSMFWFVLRNAGSVRSPGKNVPQEYRENGRLDAWG